jgi:hypothetical protein
VTRGNLAKDAKSQSQGSSFAVDVEPSFLRDPEIGDTSADLRKAPYIKIIKYVEGAKIVNTLSYYQIQSDLCQENACEMLRYCSKEKLLHRYR